jgi:hypothetical protein
VRQIPLGLRNGFVFPTLAGLHHANPIALFCGAESGNASTETRADDHDVIVKTWHEPSPSYLTEPAIPSAHVIALLFGWTSRTSCTHWLTLARVIRLSMRLVPRNAIVEMSNVSLHEGLQALN